MQACQPRAVKAGQRMKRARQTRHCCTENAVRLTFFALLASMSCSSLVRRLQTCSQTQRMLTTAAKQRAARSMHSRKLG